MASPDLALSIFQAHLLALAFAGSYVGSIYVSQNSRLTYASNSPTERAKERVRYRDDPDVIRARLKAVTISTLLSCVVVFGIVQLQPGGSIAVRYIAHHSSEYTQIIELHRRRPSY